MIKEYLEILQAPFDKDDVDIRPIRWTTNNDKAMPFAYLSAKAVIERLDEFCAKGEGRYWNLDSEVIDVPDDLNKVVVKAKITIFVDGAYICRTGIGEAEIFFKDGKVSNDPYKSAESDAIKRACANFGIGKYLYNLPKLWLGWQGDRVSGKFTEDVYAALFEGKVSEDKFEQALNEDYSPAQAPARGLPRTRGRNIQAQLGVTTRDNGGRDVLANYLTEMAYDVEPDSTIDSLVDVVLDNTTNVNPPTGPQFKFLANLVATKNAEVPDFLSLSKQDCSQLLESLKNS